MDEEENTIFRRLSPEEIKYLHPFPLIQEDAEPNESIEIGDYEYKQILLKNNQILVEIISTTSFVNYIECPVNEYIILDINIAGRRFRSRKVQASCDPSLECTFLLTLNQPIVDLVKLGKASISVVAENQNNTYIYGFGQFDWRFALAGYLREQVILYDSENEECGLIDIKMQLGNKMATMKQLESCFDHRNENNSLICQISSRSLPTPFHAFRFVHLLYKYSKTCKQVQSHQIPSIHSVISLRTGTINDLSVLLVCLLCSYGLEAFLYNNKVITYGERIIEWDIIQQKRIIIENIEPKELIGYRKIVHPLVDEPTPDIWDPSQWNIEVISPPSVIPVLIKSPQIDERKLENELKKTLTIQWKIDFDDSLVVYLRPIAATLETRELEMPDEYWTMPVASMIKENLPEKTSLKIFSSFYYKNNAAEIASKIMHKCDSIISQKPVSVGITVCTTAYAEEIYGVWTVVGFIVQDKS